MHSTPHADSSCSKLTVVMYHYVRNLTDSRYPEIKGLRVDEFEGQLDYLTKHYHFVTMEECIDSINKDRPLQPNSVLLTFDDGYSDHYNTVFPILAERGIQGTFFPSGRAVKEGVVLDVNKIHFLLASVTDAHGLMGEVIELFEYHRKGFDTESLSALKEQFLKPNRFDPKEVNFIKRLLQKALPLKLRMLITDELFRKYVFHNERAFASELYLNPKQLKVMKKNGMFIGSHGFDHFWLGEVSSEIQRSDIVASLELLAECGVDDSRFVFSYPYGNHNPKLLQLLDELGCQAAFTTEVSLATLCKDKRLEIPRLDTNDLPKSPC